VTIRAPIPLAGKEPRSQVDAPHRYLIQKAARWQKSPIKAISRHTYYSMLSRGKICVKNVKPALRMDSNRVS